MTSGCIASWDVAQRHPLPVTIKGQAKTLAFSLGREYLNFYRFVWCYRIL